MSGPREPSGKLLSSLEASFRSYRLRLEIDSRREGKNSGRGGGGTCIRKGQMVERGAAREAGRPGRRDPPRLVLNMATLRRLQETPRHLLVCEKSNFGHNKSRHKHLVETHYHNYRVSQIHPAFFGRGGLG